MMISLNSHFPVVLVEALPASVALRGDVEVPGGLGDGHGALHLREREHVQAVGAEPEDLGT